MSYDVFKNYSPVQDCTRLLQIIPEVTFSASLNELLSNAEIFGPHGSSENYKKFGPLKDCRSTFLTADIRPSEITNLQDFPYDITQTKRLSHTIELLNFLIKQISETRNKGRAYVTILPPGKSIANHSDTGADYFFNIDRYQFYYTGDEKMIQNIGDKIYPVGPGYFYFFDHRQKHEYINNSDKDLILMVFDLYKE